MLTLLGPDTGWDSIGDFTQAETLSRFLNRLDENNKLAKTIIYNLNPADNEVMATMIGNYNDGSVAGKVQWGSAWWFLDQKDGMTKQINALSNMGLLSHFVGMLTDSRSFLSFPRHEYFRRVLCNLLGKEMESGELPDDEELIGAMVRNICQSIEYFQRDEMGGLGAFSGLAQLSGCFSVMNNNPEEWSREIMWIAEQMSRIKLKFRLINRSLLTG